MAFRVSGPYFIAQQRHTMKSTLTLCLALCAAACAAAADPHPEVSLSSGETQLFFKNFGLPAWVWRMGPPT